MANFSDGTAAGNKKPVSSVRLLGLALECNSHWAGWAAYVSLGKEQASYGKIMGSLLN